jgi:membrane-associated protease RseP (regulator of RpoE activity)
VSGRANVDDDSSATPAERNLTVKQGGTGREWAAAIVLFGCTSASVWWVGRDFWGSGWGLAVPLMAILLAHESGHYVAARLHGESPSPPYFLPLPKYNPFGTLGAVLLLDDRTRSRNALMDIGAAGPIAGLVVAVAVMTWGLTQSPVEPLPASGYTMEGQSLLYWALKRAVVGPIPAGYDVTMHPAVGAAWAGFYVTFLNLLPFGQLDGGHVASALWGQHHARVARWILTLPALLAAYNLIVFGLPMFTKGELLGQEGGWPTLLSAVTPWIALQALLLAMAWWVGTDHPPTRPEAPSTARKILGWSTFGVCILLFTPSPWVVY